MGHGDIVTWRHSDRSLLKSEPLACDLRRLCISAEHSRWAEGRRERSPSRPSLRPSVITEPCTRSGPLPLPLGISQSKQRPLGLRCILSIGVGLALDGVFGPTPKR